MKNLTPKLNWILVAISFVINILWYFVPLAGEPGAVSAWKVHPVFGIFMSAIWAYFFIALLISAIKRW